MFLAGLAESVEHGAQTGVAVEQLALALGQHQVTCLVLAMHVDQQVAQPSERRDRHRHSIDVC